MINIQILHNERYYELWFNRLILGTFHSAICCATKRKMIKQNFNLYQLLNQTPKFQSNTRPIFISTFFLIGITVIPAAGGRNAQ